jgi:hypothetical protein
MRTRRPPSTSGRCSTPDGATLSRRSGVLLGVSSRKRLGRRRRDDNGMEERPAELLSHCGCRTLWHAVVKARPSGWPAADFDHGFGDPDLYPNLPGNVGAVRLCRRRAPRPLPPRPPRSAGAPAWGHTTPPEGVHREGDPAVAQGPLDGRQADAEDQSGLLEAQQLGAPGPYRCLHGGPAIRSGAIPTKWVTVVSTGRRIGGSFRREGSPLPPTESRSHLLRDRLGQHRGHSTEISTERSSDPRERNVTNNTGARCDHRLSLPSRWPDVTP